MRTDYSETCEYTKKQYDGNCKHDDCTWSMKNSSTGDKTICCKEVKELFDLPNT